MPHNELFNRIVSDGMVPVAEAVRESVERIFSGTVVHDPDSYDIGVDLANETGEVHDP